MAAFSERPLFGRVSLVLIIGITACVPLPYRVAVETGAAEPLSPTASFRAAAPQEHIWFVEHVSEELRENYPRVEIVDADSVLPTTGQTGSTVGSLVEPHIQDRLSEHEIAYVILLSGDRSSTDPKGPWVWPLGIASGRADAQLTAHILRVGEPRLSPGLRAEGGGTGTVASFGWTVASLPMAAESVAAKISEIIGARIETDHPAEKVRVILLPLR